MDPQQLAAGPPPAGIISNFENPSADYSSQIIACNVILLVIGILFVSARVVSRTLLTEWRLGWDDCERAVSAVPNARKEY